MKEIVLTILGNTGIIMLVQIFVQRHYIKKDTKDKQGVLVKEALLAVLHDRLYQLCQYLIAKGGITAEEMKNVEYIYTSYSDLGGNGTGTELFERVKKLEIRKD